MIIKNACNTFIVPALGQVKLLSQTFCVENVANVNASLVLKIIFLVSNLILSKTVNI